MKKNHPRHEDEEKKKLLRQGSRGEKNNSPLSPGENFLEISGKKNHPREGDEKKNSTPVKRQKKNPPQPNFLPPPWKSNGASLSTNTVTLGV